MAYKQAQCSLVDNDRRRRRKDKKKNKGGQQSAGIDWNAGGDSTAKCESKTSKRSDASRRKNRRFNANKSSGLLNTVGSARKRNRRERREVRRQQRQASKKNTGGRYTTPRHL